MEAHTPAPLHRCHPGSSPACPNTSDKSQHFATWELSDYLSERYQKYDCPPPAMSADSDFCLEDVFMEFRSCTLLLLD